MLKTSSTDSADSDCTDVKMKSKCASLFFIMFVLNVFSSNNQRMYFITYCCGVWSCKVLCFEIYDSDFW